MEIKLLNDIVIIFGLSIAVIFIFHKIKIPPIIGFLITGIFAGPYGLGLVKSVHEVEILAEVGILLLLFTIGIEFSIKDLLSLKKPVLIGGSLQVLLTIGVVYLIAGNFASSTGELIFFGFLTALSSTAIILKLYVEKAEIDTPHGRTALAILIFQDIIVVPMMLVTPLLAGAGGNLMTEILLLLGKAILVVVAVFVGAKYIVPNALLQIARTRSRELFLISIIVICFGIVWLTSSIGLSLALGAFLAGLIISESEYSHQALANILPFRDVFTSFFFVSIGMLLNLEYVADNLVLVAVLSLSVIIIKSVLATGAVSILGFPLRTALITGIGLGQVGEFSFILAKTGQTYGFISGELYQAFLSVSIITMAATPFLISGAPHIANLLNKLPLPQKLKKEGVTPVQAFCEKLEDHLVIVGFGMNGTNLAHASRAAKIPYVIIDMNPDRVRSEKAKGEPIYYGDATSPEVVEQTNIHHARIVVIAINDPAATRRIVTNIKLLNPDVYTIVRTRFVKEIPQLKQLGAHEVIPEEFETAVEIFARVMTKYMVPQNEIFQFIDNIRAENYKMLRSVPKDISPFRGFKIHFPDIEILTYNVNDACGLTDKSLKEIDFRNKCGATVLAIKREKEVMSNPGADFKLQQDDIIFIMAKHEKIAKLNEIFAVNT
ncbi:MAG: sodium/hydrogen exchanger [Melioribacteraceae bacterium]|nr:MAG: sodium/hydrogen exchanger [Melioribacteraceae bacterium]